MKIHTTLLALCVGIAASCSTETAPLPSPATGKADAPSCDGAKLDTHGICRKPDGRFAPKACCEQDPACFDLESSIQTSNCLDDIDDPTDVNWEACFEQADVTMMFAATCCVLDPERFMWCAGIPTLACFEFEDFVFDFCLADGPDEPVDWHTCIELSDITQQDAAACCDIAPDDFLWCGQL